MDTTSLPSLDLDEFLKLDGGIFLPADDPVPAMGVAPSYPLDNLFDLNLPSPTGILPEMDHFSPSGLQSSGGSGTSEDAIVSTKNKRQPAKKKDQPAIDPKERIRAKNRRAQARYREKQKAKRQETEVSLDHIIADVERLRLENSMLSSRNEILDKILVFRDGAASILDQSKATEHKIRQPNSLHSLDPHNSVIFERLRPTAPPATKAEYIAHCNRVNASGNEKTTHHTGDEDGSCPLTGLTRAEIIALKATSDERVQAHFKGYVDRCRDALIELEDPRSSPQSRATAEAAMMSVLQETGCLCFEHAVLNPTGLHKLLVASVGDGSEDELTKAAKYADMAQNLKLTEGQRSKIQPLREVFLQRIKRIGEERRSILLSLNSSLTRSPQPPTTSSSDLPPLSGPSSSLRSLSSEASEWIHLHKTSQALDANMREEHIACMEFVAKTFGSILTPIQKAKALVHSYPAFPDVFAICTAAQSVTVVKETTPSLPDNQSLAELVINDTIHSHSTMAIQAL